jgi:UDP-GlcNAc:undecaprenyl-phosphate/decaprenyl-phosphate GlcNAc-1-phosphate transferase
MITLSTAAFLAFLICLLVTPLVRSLALRTGVVDAAGFVHRKIHATDVPRLGGIALVVSFCVPITALLFVDTGVGRLLEEQKEFLVCLLGGSAVIALLGLYDDLRGAGAKLKLLVQTATATAVYLGGFRIEFINFPLLHDGLGLLSFPITLLWIVGITNALNLIDGLDGLAAGMAFFGVLPMTVLALADGNLMLGLITLTLMGSLLGFLVYNFHPAKIFMGDTGSMFLGFVLALVTVQTSHKSSVAASLLAPVLALGVPILDTSIAVARRAWRGRPLFAADRNHLHHRLLTAGLGHRNAVLALYAVAAGFAAASLAITFYRDFGKGLVLVCTVVLGGVLMRKVGYLTLAGGVGGTLRVGAKRRKQNRTLAAAVSAAILEINKAATVQQFADLTGQLLLSQGFTYSCLSLTSSSTGSLTYIWGEGGNASERRFVFELRGQNLERKGELVVASADESEWADDAVNILQEYVTAMIEWLDENSVEVGSITDESLSSKASQ